jgi:hypothetical protein
MAIGPSNPLPPPPGRGAPSIDRPADSPVCARELAPEASGMRGEAS